MKRIPLFFQKVHLLIARYGPAGEYTLRLHTMLCMKSGLVREGMPEDVPIEALPGNLKKHPVLLLCTGHGVITKDYREDADIVSQVENNPERFLHTAYRSSETLSEANRFCFVQLRQLDDLFERTKTLPVCGCHPVDVPESDEDAMIPVFVREFYTEKISLRRLFRPDNFHAAIAGLTANKLKIPVLVFILSILVANQFAQQNYRTINGELQMQLQALEMNRQKEDLAITQKTAALSQFNRSGINGYSQLCDEIAAGLPEKLLLKHLSLQPVTKALASHTPPSVIENVILIAGTAVHPEPVVEFTDILEQKTFVRELNLITLEFDPEERLFTFQIHIRL